MMKSTFVRGFLFALLAVVALAVYWPTFGFSWIEYDDPVYLTGARASGGEMIPQPLTVENVAFAFRNGIANVWHPLTWISHMVDVALFGDNYGAYHAMNVALHLLSGAALYGLLLALFPGKLLPAVLGTGAFLLHPTHVESVAWISERKDVLSGLFFHLSLWAYVAYARAGKKKGASGRRRIAYWLSLVAFGIGLLAKPSIIVLPPLLVLLDLWPLQRGGFEKGRLDIGRIIARQWREKLPFALLAGAAVVIGILFQTGGSHSYWMGQQSIVSRCYEVPGTLLTYLRLTLWPVDLSVSYPRPQLTPLLLGIPGRDLLFGFGVVIFGAIGFVIALGWKKLPAFAFGFGWFLVCLIPFWGFMYVGSSFTNDRYTYLALSGLAAAVGWGISGRGKQLRIALVTLSALVLAAWAFLSHRQVFVWEDNLSLWTHAIEAQPRDAVGYANLAASYDRLGDVAKSKEINLRCIEQFPADYTSHYNLGQLFGSEGSVEARAEAMRYYEKALEIFPLHAPSNHNLSLLLIDEAYPQDIDVSRALGLLETACDGATGRNAVYWMNYGRALAMSGDFDKAVAALETSLQMPGAKTRGGLADAIQDILRQVQVLKAQAR